MRTTHSLCWRKNEYSQRRTSKFAGYNVFCDKKFRGQHDFLLKKFAGYKNFWIDFRSSIVIDMR